MKQVETISINGLLTDIESDAYTELNIYLESIGKYFENEQGGNEILADIEARIAELFNERRNGTKRVVTLDDVRYVIDTLGSIEDITDSENETDSQHDYFAKQKTTKRLYRNIDRKVIAGVCSGIAARIAIDPVLVRLIFIAVTFIAPVFFKLMAVYSYPWLTNWFSLGCFLYLILWIVIPAAKTTSQKLEMQGEAINIDNIIKNIKKNIPSQMFNNSQEQSEQSEKPRKSSNLINNFANVFAEITGQFFRRIVRPVLGIILCILGLKIFLLLILCIFVQDFIFFKEIKWIKNEQWVEAIDFFSLNEIIKQMISPSSHTILICCTLIFFGLIIAACFYWGIKLIMGLKTKRRRIHIILLLVWFACIPTATVVCLSEARNYKGYNEINEIINLPYSDTIRLSSSSQLKILYNPLEIFYDENNQCFYGKPHLSIHKSADSTIKMEIRKTSHGKNMFDAYERAEKTDYTVGVSENPLTLSFPSYFTASPQNEWKFQQVKIFLYLPENTHIIKDRFFNETHIMW